MDAKYLSAYLRPLQAVWPYMCGPKHGTGWVDAEICIKSIQLKIAAKLEEEFYTVSQIKTPMRTIVHNFVKFLPIFTIFWLADSAGNL